MKRFIRNFEDINMTDLPLAGEKNILLCEMARQFKDQGIRIPEGFSILTTACNDFLSFNHIQGQLTKILAELDTVNFSNLRTVGRKARQVILEGTLPYRLQVMILAAYEQLIEKTGPDLRLTVMANAGKENAKILDFSDQRDHFHNITGGVELLEACHYCYASLYSDHNIKTRTIRNIDHQNATLSISVQRMIRADLASSGTGTSLNAPGSGNKMIAIKSIWGLHSEKTDKISDGDEFVWYRQNPSNLRLDLISRKMGKKLVTTGCSDRWEDFSARLESRRTLFYLQNKFSLSLAESQTLANWGILIESYFQWPVFFSWAKDGFTQKLYLTEVKRKYHSAEPQIYPLNPSRGQENISPN